MIPKGISSSGNFDRLFAVFIILSPFLNLIWAARLTQIPDWWTLSQLIALTHTITAFYWLLAAGTLLTGTLILLHAPGAWLSCLLILGLNLGNGLIELPKNLQLDRTNAVVAISANIFIFVFILVKKVVAQYFLVSKISNLEREVSLKKVLGKASEQISGQGSDRILRRLSGQISGQTEKRQSTTRTGHQPLVISFSGIGIWAQVTHLNQKGVGVRRLGAHAPHGIEGRRVEITLANGVTFQAACQKMHNDRYFFHFTNATPEDLNRLRNWAKRKTSSHPSP